MGNTSNRRPRRSPEKSLRNSLRTVRTIDEAVLLLVDAGLGSKDFQAVINYPLFRDRLVEIWKSRGYSYHITPEQALKIMGDRMMTVKILENSRDYSTVFNGRIRYELPLLELVPYRESDLANRDVVQFLLPVVEYNDLVTYRPFQFDGDGSWQDLISLCESGKQTSWWALLRNRSEYSLDEIPSNERIATVYEYLFWIFGSGRISHVDNVRVLCRKVMRESDNDGHYCVVIDVANKIITVTEKQSSDVEKPHPQIARQIYTVLNPCLIA